MHSPPPPSPPLFLLLTPPRKSPPGVHAIHPTPPPFLTTQLSAIFTDIGVDVVKIGMLASAATVSSVAHCLATHIHPPIRPHPPPSSSPSSSTLSSAPGGNVIGNGNGNGIKIVLDPVMVATSGARLLDPEAVRALRTELLPLADVLTPNLPEAMLLLRDAGVVAREEEEEVEAVDRMVEVAGLVRGLWGKGRGGVLLKGGHVPLRRKVGVGEGEGGRKRKEGGGGGKQGEGKEEDEEAMVVVNVWHDGERVVLYESDYVKSRNTHGTGCSLASAIASQMVCSPSMDIVEQIKAACEYIEMGIRTSVDWKLGQGSGPINHFHNENGKARLTMREYPLKDISR